MDAERRLREEGIAGDIYLFKNNTDSAGNSYGCHENYLVGRHGEFSRLADVLIPFLVTRQIMCGAGKVLQTPRGAVYCVSQRAEHIWEGVSSAPPPGRDRSSTPATSRTPTPSGSAGCTSSSATPTCRETTTLLKIGTTDLVLRMIEAGVVMRDLTLENAIRAIREVSHDMTGTPPRQARQRPRGQRAGDPARVLRQGPRLRAAARHRRDGRARARPVGAHAQGRRERRPRHGRARDRLGRPSTS